MRDGTALSASIVSIMIKLTNINRRITFTQCFLGWSASVGRLAFLVETTLVADSDAVGVVVAGVSTHLVFWTAGIDHAILRNVIVVTDLWIIKNISLAALHAEGAENGGEDSDDEIDDGFPVYFHDD